MISNVIIIDNTKESNDNECKGITSKHLDKNIKNVIKLFNSVKENLDQKEIKNVAYKLVIKYKDNEMYNAISAMCNLNFSSLENTKEKDFYRFEKLLESFQEKPFLDLQELFFFHFIFTALYDRNSEMLQKLVRFKVARRILEKGDFIEKNKVWKISKDSNDLKEKKISKILSKYSKSTLPLNFGTKRKNVYRPY